MNRGVRRLSRVMGALAVAMLVGAAPAAASPFSWTGQATTPSWSNASNWNPAASPSGATSLTFGALGPPCGGMTLQTCYAGTNDVSGVSVSSISIDTGEGWYISGLPLMLGGGGLAAAPSAAGTGATFDAPLMLTANQTWTVNGFLSVGQITGAGRSLTVRFAQNSFGQNGVSELDLSADTEIGPVNVSGPGDLQITGAGRLNENGAPVALGTGSALWPLSSTSLGPLTTANQTALMLTGNDEGSPVTVDVLGTVSLAPGTLVSIGLYGSGGASELIASGAHLGGLLQLYVEPGTGGTCVPVKPGQSFPLVDSKAPITGQLAPNGATLQVYDQCAGASATPVVALISDTAHTVTATIIAAISTPPIKRYLARILKPTGKHASIKRILASRGYQFKATAPAPGTADIAWDATAKRKTVIVATADQVVGPRIHALRVTLTMAGRKLLRHATKLKLTAFADFAYPAAGAHKTFTLR